MIVSAVALASVSTDVTATLAQPQGTVTVTERLI